MAHNQPTGSDAMTGVQVELTVSEANRLRKWGSLWVDLLHADMALKERQDLPANLTHVFTRRALWESAVISYGRMQFSDRKRKLTHEDLIRDAGGEEALAFHERLTEIRHNHIAHRLSPEYETTAVVAHYSDTGDRPTILELGVSTWIGPPDESDLAEHFRRHISAVRDTLWKTYLAPIGEALVLRHPTRLGPASPCFPGLESDAEHLVVSCTLWAEANGTGI